MKAIIVGLPQYYGKVFTVEELKALPEFTGELSSDMSQYRNNGGFCRRVELDNQPLLKGLCGPMWDGGMLRYETWEVYDMLSR